MQSLCGRVTESTLSERAASMSRGTRRVCTMSVYSPARLESEEYSPAQSWRVRRTSRAKCSSAKCGCPERYKMD
ncbi:hypothetical protein Mp_4g21070 [Marchantia polymorpha subsp. ruderalis]|uniref:Uncharacterized protein n=2 Tax=Marchantia polymorpha TaxID=3197 RepID=A0AAF6BC70_MARPO|nr:hypothetical protein MARPO_0101s0053 [Marchantia polymorpha]BBN09604.1 hypothetical protein Mp_4g21070 [Marchantia polymorpha subsp. ruderalis]|eukprot:PTQ32262.1 hypothetical protein MARPO_0101s0053 [Marchantia polymorpha]